MKKRIKISLNDGSSYLSIDDAATSYMVNDRTAITYGNSRYGFINIHAIIPMSEFKAQGYHEDDLYTWNEEVANNTYYQDAFKNMMTAAKSADGESIILPLIVFAYNLYYLPGISVDAFEDGDASDDVVEYMRHLYKSADESVKHAMFISDYQFTDFGYRQELNKYFAENIMETVLFGLLLFCDNLGIKVHEKDSLADQLRLNGYKPLENNANILLKTLEF